MKILVFSDTHGSIARACEIVEKTKDVDLLVHLGDVVPDAQRLQERTGITCVSVKGNMDGAMRSEDSRAFLDTEYGRIWLTHGHCDGAGFRDYERMAQTCRALACRAVIFGHTHVALNDEIDGIRLMNPGSLTRPRDGSHGSYAIVRTSSDRLECAIMYYNARGEKRSRGGFLRGLINYSDRF